MVQELNRKFWLLLLQKNFFNVCSWYGKKKVIFLASLWLAQKNILIKSRPLNSLKNLYVTVDVVNFLTYIKCSIYFLIFFAVNYVNIYLKSSSKFIKVQNTIL